MRLPAVRIKTGVLRPAWIFVFAALVALGLGLSLPPVQAQNCASDKDQARIELLQGRIKSFDYRRAEAQIDVEEWKVKVANASDTYQAGVAAKDEHGKLEWKQEAVDEAKKKLKAAEGRVRRLTREVANYKKELEALAAKPVCAPGTTPTPAPPRTAKKQTPGQYFQKEVPPLRTFTPPSQRQKFHDPRESALAQGGG